MRRASQDVDWLTVGEGLESALAGISLGFDFCAEHEHGASFIQNALGIPSPEYILGVADRTMTKVPEYLEFVQYDEAPKDRRVKKKMPAALLHCTRIYDDTFHQLAPNAKAKYLGADFFWSFTDRHYAPGRSDLVSTWDGTSGFAVHVRGADNVEKLKELHEAFLRKDISFAAGSAYGFQRRAPSLVIVSRLSEETKNAVLQKDLDFKYLYEKFKATGIEKRLANAGKKSYALSPRWRNGKDSALLIWLNPMDQRSYAAGWFTVQELEQWAENRGPVVDDLAIRQQLKRDDPNWSYHLLTGLNAAGIQTNAHERLVWLDAEKTQVGVSLLVSTSSTSTELSDGVYPLEVIDKYVQQGKILYAAEKAAAL